jgi:carboxylesterase type B
VSTTQLTCLTDRYIAVEWVRDNIAQFGGDPERIVIQGQSAGGASVDYWAYAYPDDPIVHGLISESGQATDATSEVNSTKNYLKVSKALGCGDKSAGLATLDCLRTKNISDIMDAIRPIALDNQVALAAGFTPVADGIVAFSNYSKLAKAGKFAKIPILLGNNDHESGFFKLAANYTSSSAALNKVFDALELLGFTCPAGKAAGYRTSQSVPAWRYRYYGDYPNVRLPPDNGAYHCSEIFTLFGTSSYVSGSPNTAVQQAVGAYMRKAWATFAKNPTTGLSADFGWPTYDANSESFYLLHFNVVWHSY